MEENDSNMDEMWDIIVSYMNKRSVVNNEVKIDVYVDTVLKRIYENLTFDNPGLYPQRVTSQEERAELTYGYSWLLNELLYIAANDKIKIFRENNLALQNELISSAFLKQPWWVKKALEMYCDVLDKLSKYEQIPADGIEIVLSSVESHKLKVTELVYEKIKISTMAAYQDLKSCCISVLSHAVTLVADFHDSTINRATEQIFRVLERDNLYLKHYSLMYFNKLLKSATEYDENVRAVHIRVTNTIFHIFKDLIFWIANEDVKERDNFIFNKGVCKYLKEIEELPIRYERKESQQLLYCFLKIVEVFFKHIDGTIFTMDMMKQIFRFIEKHFSSCEDHADVLDMMIALLPNTQQVPSFIYLYDHCLLYELQQSDLKNCDLFSSSKIWQHFSDLITKEISSSAKVVLKEKFMDHMIIIREILDLLNNFEYKFLRWHQKQHQENEGLCCCSELEVDGILDLRKTGLKYFNTDISGLIENFVILISARDNVEIEMMVIATAISFAFLKNTVISQEMTNDQKCFFMSIIVSPFYNSLKQSTAFSGSTAFQEIVNKIPNNFKMFFEDLETNELFTNSLVTRSLNFLSNLNMSELHPSYLDLHLSLIDFILASNVNDWKRSFVESFINSLIFNMDHSTVYLNKFLVLVNSKDMNQIPEIASVYKDIICLSHKNCSVFYEVHCKEDWKNTVTIECLSCAGNVEDSTRKASYLIPLSTFGDFNAIVKIDESFLTVQNVETKCKLVEILPSYFQHSPKKTEATIWTCLLSEKNDRVLMSLNRNLTGIMTESQKLQTSEKELEDYHQYCLKNLLQMTRENLDSKDQKIQSLTINIIFNFANAVDNEEVLMHCFRKLIYFMITFTSCVKNEACLLATEMCHRREVTPLNIMNWYRQKVLKIIVPVAVYNYSANLSLSSSLDTIRTCFGFARNSDFLHVYYQEFVAILLPFCVKDPEVMGILNELTNILQQDIGSILSTSFLKIFPYVYINEDVETNNACIDFVLENTGSSLLSLLQHNVRKTMAECLMYYHQSPDFVMKALESLTSKSIDKFNSVEAANFIAMKFLGVLIHFEVNFTNKDSEKSVKRESLQSLGSIIRLLGAQHLTHFQIKIMAVLKTAYSIVDVDLKDICLQVWKIFIFTADVTTLGPILSTIFVSLEPFLQNYPTEVNEIYKYLVIDNENLLSLHIPDLFFVEDRLISADIKRAIQGQIKRHRNNETFLEKFQTFLDYTNHEDSRVRIYGLKFCKKLLENNRKGLKDMIVGQISINPMIEVLLDILMKNCKSENPDLQLKAAEVLGEIGAIEPGLLPANYAKQNAISSFSVHSDEFAAVALGALCKAYQFQNISKYIDAYSLAIQEILKSREVDPRQEKNMEVWKVVPERMTAFMIPLLTSTYTAVGVVTNYKHPVFGRTTSSTEWAFNWASKLISKVSDNHTRHLLESIKPSLRCEMNLSALFLPYIVIHSIESSNAQEIVEIYEELNFIFKAVVSCDDSDDVEMVDQQTSQQALHFMKHFLYLPQESTTVTDGERDTAMKCSKLIFGIFDFLESFLRSSLGNASNQLYADVDSLLNKFNNKLLAKVNFKCGEFARALIYLESYIKENPGERLQNELTFLANIYAELGDSDSVEGLKHVKKEELSLTEQILINNVTGKLHESAACYERMLQIGNVTSMDIKKLTGCYVGLDQPETALMVSESVMKDLLNESNEYLSQEIKAEPLWRLGRFEELDELLERTDSSKTENWGVKCGKLFLKFRKNDFDGFSREVKNTRQAILKILRASESEEGAYFKDYPDIIKIHLIDEFEKAEECVTKIKGNTNLEFAEKCLQALIDNWDDRLEFLQPIPAVVEPILCIRRILLGETKNNLKQVFAGESSKRLDELLNAEIGKLWIKSTRYACKNKMFQQAHLYILNADAYQPKELFLEKAKYYWQKGDQINAIKLLDRGTKELLGMNPTLPTKNLLEKLTPENRKLYAKGKLLIATLNAEAGHVGFDRNNQLFREALEAHKDCEKTNVLFAAYLDKNSSLQNYPDNRSRLQVQLEIMNYYGRSMVFGCDYVYQSMPRYLTIWLDNTTAVKVDKHSKEIYDKMNKLTDTLCQRVPPYFFFTAFSQIVSRIGHPNPDVYSTLKSIIIKIILSYTQQSLWMLLSIFKSSYPIRVKRCNEIFMDKRLSDSGMQKLIKDFNTMAEKFIELCSKEIRSSSRVKVSSIVPDLPRLFKNGKFSNIILPIQENLTLVRDCSNKKFVFPNEFVYIRGIEEEVEQLRSLQRPRKIKIKGSNGKSYNMLLKHKDDLRKDFRFMEFNAVVREYLCKDSEARHRKLNMRSYAVIPMNEESGIIEWVPNLRTYKEILTKQYQKCGIKIPSLTELREWEIEKKPIEIRRKKYLELVKLHCPVFDNWFREQFPNPHNYFQARSAYIKSTAVMSMVGYMMGLGDRHGENILFDAASGDTVHVDFNCLFNRGESLGIPEVVPFRLTNNMVQAMGPLGMDGPFRKCCEITLRVLQREASTLMSFLRPFVYDPLMSWERHPDSSTRDNSERTDPKATIYVSNIEQRLKGIVKKYKGSSSIPLSTEGQVNVIIEEATNLDNLSSMFYGWSSFM